MTNDERITNHETRRAHDFAAGLWRIGLRTSGFFRHSDFVIRHYSGAVIGGNVPAWWTPSASPRRGSLIGYGAWLVKYLINTSDSTPAKNARHARSIQCRM